MQLSSRFLLLRTSIFILLGAIFWLTFDGLVERINKQWGREFAYRQVLFDKHRTLSPLIREIELARKMAAEPALLEMALNEHDPLARRRGLELLESYRFRFRDHSYFAAFAGTGHYYFNDAANSFAGRQLRYTLSKKEKNDAWFYATLKSGEEYQVNVDPDVHLDVVKVWINVLIKHEGRTLGVIGTGIDLAEFLRESVGIQQPGVDNFFVDRSFAIQLSTDQNMIDFASLTKEVDERIRIDRLFTQPADMAALQRLAEALLKKPAGEVETQWVEYQGHRHLLGIAWIPELNWYDLTLMDEQSVSVLHGFGWVPLLFVFLFLIAMVTLGWFLNRWVLSPINRLHGVMLSIQQGDDSLEPPLVGKGEVAALAQAFRSMVDTVRDHQRNLEHKVVERTEALQQSEARFRMMFERHSSPMLLIAPDSGEIMNANKAASSFYGYTVEQMRQMNIGQINMLTAEEIAHERLQAKREERNYFVFPHRLADGTVRTVEVHSSPVEVDGQILLFSIVHDITDRQILERQMHDLAFYDVLTGLPNRRLLLDRLSQGLATCIRTRKHAALMFLDLDNFKILNDLHGHEIGDQMLIQVGRRLHETLREEDSAARFGGDEFVVLLESLSEDIGEAVLQAEAVAEKIRQSLSSPFILSRINADGEPDEVAHHCSSSIGVTVFRDHTDEIDQLLKWADMAMYRAKEAGRNTIRFFDLAMQAAVEKRAALEADLHEALAQQQFELFYQVQVDAARRPQGAEALLRWNHPLRGLVPPLEFIPLAEETGLILPIGNWVLDSACAQIRAWHADPLLSNLSLAVNVSARQFRQTDFVELVQAAVKRHGIPPTLLKLELTESLVLDDVADSIAKMTALREFGVRFSMDDFGTGYSSLSYLKSLPLNQLKIDQSFVRSIVSDSADRVLVMTIIDLSMNFELDVVAEGVETDEQFMLLHRYGCGNFQGYLFSRPVPVADFERQVLDMLQKGKRTVS